MSSPKTFDEVAKEIAEEKGITLEEKPEQEQEPEFEPELELSPSVIDEDNHKIRTVIEKLEKWGWHPQIQKEVKLYVTCAETKTNIVAVDKDGKESNERTSFQYLHKNLQEELFFYQNAVNIAIRNRDYNFSLRKKIILFLGCSCVFCGTEDIDYLQLDHKNRDGGKERQKFKKHNLNPMLYYWNNLIDAYLRIQVLCIKCHKLKSTYRISQEQIDEKVNSEVLTS
jgi:hypothetical protein